MYHPPPPDPKPPANKPTRVYEAMQKVRGAFDRRTYQRNWMRRKRQAEKRQQQ
jgi:hypothetical protein